MILDALIRVVILLFTGILGLFPSYTLPGEVTDLGAGLGSAIAAVNGVFPVVTLGKCIALVLGVWLFIAAFTFVAWVYDKIPAKFT